MGLLAVIWFLVTEHAGATEPVVSHSPEVRLLIVTGMDYPGHKWRETTPYLLEALGKDERLRIDVLSDPYRLDQFDLESYQAVILHFMNWERPDPNQNVQDNLSRFVEKGGGLVLIHFACGAFGEWDAFSKLAGRVWDKVNTHDPRGPFDVNIIDQNHPITRGMQDFETDDELYTCLTGSKPVSILAQATSKVKKDPHPMALVHRYGKGRVFLTPLGHDVKALQATGTTQLILRACAWVSGLEPR